MKRVRQWCIALLSLFALSSAYVESASAAKTAVPLSTSSEDLLRISTTRHVGEYSQGSASSRGHDPMNGYMPVEFNLENLAQYPRRVSIKFGFTYDGSKTFYSREVNIPPMKAARVFMFVPLRLQNSQAFFDRGDNLSCQISDSDTRREYGSISFEPVRDWEARFLGTVPAGFNLKAFDSLGNDKLYLTQFSPMDVPADPRFYSSMDAFFLEQKDLDAMGQEHRQALMEWVNSGGTLFINNATPNVTHQGGYGRGGIRICSIDTSNDKKVEEFYDSIMSGKGKVQNLMTPCEDMISKDRIMDFVVGLPAGTSLFLIAFVILVGPVNLWVFAPRNKRQRLFVTMPLISLGFSLILAVYIIVADGFGGQGERVSIVNLSPDSPSAFVTQTQMSRTGILTESSFPLDEFTLIGGAVPAQSKYSSNWQALEKAWRDDKNAYGYFSSRSGIMHHLSRNVPTRARVTLVSREGEAPVVQTTLPTPLKNFLYRDGAGKVWAAGEVAPGTKVNLVAATKAQKKEAPELRNYFNGWGGSSELAPIETLPSIKWTDKVQYRGKVQAQ